MRHIQKSEAPPELRTWRAAVEASDDPNGSYNHLPSEVLRALRDHLVAEQFGLCAYTGRQLDSDHHGEVGWHIEHLKPQSICSEAESVDYFNVVVAVPGGSLPYGAQAKADWYDEALFVSPTQSRCETAFDFTTDGAIHPDATDAAQTTIDRLRLDHRALVELRRAAIEAVTEQIVDLPPESDPRSFVASYGQPHDGLLPSFSFVITRSLLAS